MLGWNRRLYTFVAAPASTASKDWQLDKIGLFDPHLPVNAYRATNGQELVCQNLHTCLRGDALAWYSSLSELVELSGVLRRDLWYSDGLPGLEKYLRALYLKQYCHSNRLRIYRGSGFNS